MKTIRSRRRPRPRNRIPEFFENEAENEDEEDSKL